MAVRLSYILLDGPEKEVTAYVQRCVYDALLRNIQHQSSGYDREMADNVSTLAVKGMRHDNRSVRLIAG